MVLTRAAELGGAEVLLVKRQESLRFMGGLFVFPGGKVDDVDCEDGCLKHLPQDFEPPLRPMPGHTLSRATACGVYVAAIRELFEEVGVLLARTAGGKPLGAGEASAVAQARQELIDGSAGFAAVLQRLDLQLDVGALTYWAHWVTPSVEGRRFDTRFFMAECPPGQTPHLDLHEASDMLWLTPERALETYAARQIPLSPPTFRNLQELSGADHPDALRLRARSRRIDVLLPKVVILANRRVLLYPWDPEYLSAPGEGFDVGDLGYGPSRMILDNGIWRSLDAGS